MFSSTFFRDFDEDPFFSMHRDRMRQMDNMFGVFGHGDPLMAITDGGTDDRQHRHHVSDRSSRDLEPAGRRNRDTDLMPSTGAGGMWDPFSYMNSMMSNMQNVMGNTFQQMENLRNDLNGHSYVQSSVMSYSNTGQGEPKIFQATTATRQAPGGLRETRKALRDSEAGIEKMSVGRHLNERGHVVTRQRNTRTGDTDENQDYLNLDETEAPQFDEEWRHVASRYIARRDQNAVGHQSDRTRSRAIDDRRPHRTIHHEPSNEPRRSTTNKNKAIEQGRRVEKAY